jgi:hypothetical protein
MSDTLDPVELSNYVAKRSDSELLEDLSHLFEVNIVTSALAATDFGRSYKLPISSVTNINSAFQVYRDELVNRSTNSDKLEDVGYTLLGEYFRCVKVIRALSKYINRVVPEIESDFSNSYTPLFEHKTSADFKFSVMED